MQKYFKKLEDTNKLKMQWPESLDLNPIELL